ncbi:MAG TPA: PKD domain-containing protein, partial [Acidimicrobiales bacterium]
MLRKAIPMVLVGVAAAVVLAAFGPWAGATPPAAFTWSMPDRFGVDADHDDVIDERTDAAYVDPATWPVDFDACAAGGQPHPGATYTWVFGDGTPPSDAGNDCTVTHPYAEVDVPYQVTLTLADGSGSSTTTQTILPRDHVIVSLGDSAASGEGNPDHLEPALRSRSFTSAGFSHTWNDEQCHRSALAGPAQAAIRLEQRDPHSSVTFIHLACSGARITRGVIGPYQGLVNDADPRLDCDDPGSPFYIRYPDPKLDAPRPTDPDCLPPQVEQLASIIGGRAIDAITVSGGINDVFFSKVAFACLLTDDCSTMPSDQMMGPDGQAQTADQFLGVRFGQLRSRIGAMADQLMDLPLRSADPAHGIAAGRVFLTTYPNPETDDDGSVCHTDEVARVARMPQWLKDAVDDLLAPAGMDSDAGIMTQHEWGWAAEAIVQRLKTEIVAATGTANAEYPGRFAVITEPTGAFATHGYCANDTWVRDIPTSFLYQRDPEGSFHPNRAGHFYGYALPIEDHLAAHLGITAPELAPHVPGDIEAFEAINQDLAQLMEVMSRIDIVEEIQRLLPDDTRKKRDRDGDRDLDLARLPQLIRDAVGGLRDKLVAEGTPKALSELDAWLDGLDDEVGPLDLEVDATITPHAATERYELLLDVTLGGPLTEMRFDTGGLRLDGPDVEAEVAMSFRVIVEPERSHDRVYLLPADDNGIRVTLKAEQTVPPGQPETALLGVVDVAVHGPAAGKAVDFESSLTIEPRDPNGNGEISVDELVGRSFSGAFSVACDPTSHLALDLHVTAGLPGLTGEIAGLAVDDANLCDGLATPTVDFADPDFAAVQNLGPHDVVDAVIAIAQALQVVQERADLDLPFADGALSDVVDVATDVRRFLVDAGWTDPDDPLTPVPMEEGEERTTSLADLVAGLEDALGLPDGAMGLRYEPDQQRFALDLGLTAQAAGVTVPVDGSLLERAGIADAAGEATVAADATAT